jgi:hypothetical protein
VIKYRRLSWAGYVTRMGGGSSTFNILTGNPTGGPLGALKRRWRTTLENILSK